MASVAVAARRARSIRIVATLRNRVVHAERQPELNDLRLRAIDEWRLDAEGIPPLDGTSCGEIGHPLIRRDVLWTTIRISRVIERIDAYENVPRFQHFGPREGEREENCIASRHVGDWDSGVAIPILGYGDFARQRRTAKGPQVDIDDHVIVHGVASGHTSRRFDLDRVALSVTERHRMNGIALIDRVGQQRRRIQPAAQEQDGSGHQPRRAWSKSSFKSSMCSSPTETRSRFSGARVSGPSTEARCSTRLSVPPRLVAWVKSLSRLATASDCSRFLPACTESMPPNPRICRLATS